METVYNIGKFEIDTLSTCKDCGNHYVSFGEYKGDKWFTRGEHIISTTKFEEITRFINLDKMSDDGVYYSNQWCCNGCVNSQKVDDNVKGVIYIPSNTDVNSCIEYMEAVDNKLILPMDIFFSNYDEVKRVLTVAGGKYSKGAFVFKSDAQTIQHRILSGETVNDKKKFQFFATPQELADRVYQKLNHTAGLKTLEPSAGNAGLLNQIPKEDVDCIELMDDNYEYLIEHGYNVIGRDFTTMNIVDTYDRIIANPPFTKNQDIKHIKMMYKALKDGGRLVSVASVHWEHASTSACVAFRKWLDNVGAEVEQVDSGAFKESGTNIKTCIITINK